MAALASGRKTGGHVVWSCRCFEVRRMAGIALRGHRLEFAGGRSLVAGIAVDRSVRSSQRKAVVMLLNLLNGDLPSTDRVALLAVRSQLALVNIGVTILANLSNIGENRPDVTFSTTHRLMHAAQRIFRLVVVEFRNAADWSPGGRCVAVLTGNAQVAVWAVRASGNLRLCTSRSGRKREHQNDS